MKRLACALALVLACALPARAGEIIVFAAASLTNALGEMAPVFAKRNPGLTLRGEYAASGTLLRRMDNGDACDVFLSADPQTMDAAEDRRRIAAATRTVFAGNALVLAVPAGNPAHVTDLESLFHGGVQRIGVGNPESVPAGRYAKRALQEKAMWFALTGKLVYYPSVRHVLAAVKASDCDAGFVYATDAAIAGKAVAIAATVPLTPPVTYTAAVAAKAPNPQGAAAFLAFLATPEAKAILTRFGFTVP
ncbi:molybdenum ABC transporter, periplasmic molybdate-binding protein [Solidesulfovibrio fructosivorans JJ]]|uniref:Molybdenum ABC transporter, periplasmic molybdate-binding protein n=1 Tax=Solidesulfovibrio fructosivorans JJ] TaxID=596151 RepID=E1JYW3_SOLFR|nr:molybdate ABC transporter substrate-binding protein [Solidesulfovibrio fructosivorans]EFL50533.1 molybdenum ABC transporter, periplasmic molybdate-binding protein [Solidesulfovibrio fructosivorans JJ]]